MILEDHLAIEVFSQEHLLLLLVLMDQQFKSQTLVNRIGLLILHWQRREEQERMRLDPSGGSKEEAVF